MSSIIVCGGRDFVDYPHLEERLNSFHVYIKNTFDDTISLIIHGAARGADSLAQDYAIKSHIPYKAYPADWNTHGKSAGIKRNLLMLNENPKYVIGFYGGNGTAHMLSISRNKGIPVFHIK